MRDVEYLGAVHGRDGNYGILFPDFLGCVSSGATVDEALRQGREVLQFHVEAMEEDGDTLPEPVGHPLEAVALDFADPDDPDPDDWVGMFPVKVRLADKFDQLAVVLPPQLAGEVSSVTRHPNRFVVEATRRELARLKQSA